MTLTKLPIKRPPAIVALLVLHGMLSIGALGGGGVLIADPSGGLMGVPRSLLQGLPMRTFLIPGLSLVIVLGVFPLVTAIGLVNPQAFAFLETLNPFKARCWTFVASLCIGVYLIGWTVGEMMLWGWVWLSAIYCAWGVAVLAVPFTPSAIQYFRMGERNYRGTKSGCPQRANS